ncbi:MAG: 4Fe-4S dicluster domain-containing protein [bacterium]|nr:4Fe-4S dicluster domain-containing protein [bacterium]
MKVLRMDKRHLAALLEILRRWGEVHVPVKHGVNSHRWEPYTELEKVAYDALRTVIPAKKYFYRPRETMFRFDTREGYKSENTGLTERLVLFGIHPCGMHALETLDNLFAGRYADNYYFTRRENIMIVATSCIPDKHCFCKSMGTDAIDEGFDLFLTDLGDAFLVGVGTSRGDDVVSHRPELFTEVDEGFTQRYLEFRRRREQAYSLTLEISDLPTILDLEYESPIWDKLGERCYSCGSCSMVCPTCTCYDVHDALDLTGGGARMREWDCCLFREHALVAGGHNASSAARRR